MLYAEDVARSFGAVDVLDGVSFVIGDGERVGLVGPNGAGKSTILRLLAGDDRPDEGHCGVRGGGTLGFLTGRGLRSGSERAAETRRALARSAVTFGRVLVLRALLA